MKTRKKLIVKQGTRYKTQNTKHTTIKNRAKATIHTTQYLAGELVLFEIQTGGGAHLIPVVAPNDVHCVRQACSDH